MCIKLKQKKVQWLRLTKCRAFVRRQRLHVKLWLAPLMSAPIARWAFLFLVSLNTSTGFCSWHPVCLTPYRPRGWTLNIGTFFCWCHISFALPGCCD